MKTELPDLVSLVAVTFHLMTCYSLRPCPRLAWRVAEQLDVLLQAYGETIGPWQGTFVKLRDHWLVRTYPRWGTGGWGDDKSH